MNKQRYFQSDTYHHLYNRGIGKQTIFKDEHDYQFFLKKLLLYKRKYYIEILCYCLMPNHFHLFVRQTKQTHTISKFMSDLTNSFTKGINKKYERSGVIFESRTKSKIIYDEKDFPVVAKYILLNPVKAKLCKEYSEYDYSSAKELLALSEVVITDKTILSCFANIKKFKEFMLLEEEINASDTRLFI